ncbi:MAG: monovalent cation/H+ antiporter complex subunit F [Actinomycetota bacterium]|nr:monovalent cation/H+ antiporter complex subunit F [Actinomycetota bacterium]
MTLLLDLGVLWLAGLVGACLLLVLRARTAPTRILALDTLALVLVALLVLFTMRRGTSFYLDAALVLALLGFVATLGAARYHEEGRPF